MSPRTDYFKDFIRFLRDVNYINLIVNLSLIGNIVFFIILSYKHSLPLIIYISILSLLILIPPVVIGYANKSFILGVGIGILPVLSLALDQGSSTPVTEYVGNMIKLSILWGALALPIPTILFGIGILTRERHLRGKRTHEFARRATVAFVITAMILIINFMTDILNTGILH